LGYRALYTEDTGNRSVAIGDFALTVQNNADSNYNTAVGYAAGLSVTTGVPKHPHRWSCRGCDYYWWSCNDATSTVGNNAIGYLSLSLTRQAVTNVAFGASTLSSVILQLLSIQHWGMAL
jgi:hypothetical protein